jgi:hypothetical protein
VTKARTISESTLETDPHGIEAMPVTESEGSHSGDPSLANPILVPYADEDDVGTTINIEGKPKMAISRLEIISQHNEEIGIKRTTTLFLEQHNRKRTMAVYDRAWRAWARWCDTRKPTLDPKKYDGKQLLQFFLDHKEYSLQYLKVMRAAINSVFRAVHHEKPPISTNPLIQNFFKAKQKVEVKIPMRQQIETWDVDLLTTHLARKY